MATFKIVTHERETETVEADFVVFEDGRYLFRTWDGNLNGNVNTHIIADKYVRSVSREG